MTTRINTLNLSDVALVDARDLGMVMQYMVKSGRGLAMLRGVTEAELREIETRTVGRAERQSRRSGSRSWCASAA